MPKKIKKEKIVGILGGMGPYAAVDFLRRLLDETPAKNDWEHLHILIDNNVKIPSRTRAVLYGEKSPVPDMISSINKLGLWGADFVVVPCNSAHYFYNEVRFKIKIPWLNMIEVISQSIPYSRPLILGGYIVTTKKLYDIYLPNSVYPAIKDANFITKVIEEIKLTNKLSKKKHSRFIAMINKYKNEIDSILLACTELPIVFHDKLVPKIPIIDANKIYAQKTIEFAKKIYDNDAS